MNPVDAKAPVLVHGPKALAAAADEAMVSGNGWVRIQRLESGRLFISNPAPATIMIKETP